MCPYSGSRAGSDTSAKNRSISEGGPAIIRYAVNRAQSVQGLVLYGTMAKGSRSKSYPFALTREQYDTWLGKLIQSWGSPAGIEYFAPSRAKDPVLREWWAAMLRLGASPGSVRMVLEVLRDIDVRHLLSKVHIPALVIHRRYDQVMRVAAGRYLAEYIPENRYVELDGADHWWWVGDTEVLLEEIKSFVKVGVTP
jgi:pimeloyl-ACP methyl ester carboxylesterase